MGLKISGNLFYGPMQIEQLVVKRNHNPVVFCVVCRSGDPWDPVFKLIDVGFTNYVETNFSFHPDKEKWQSQNVGVLQIYLYDLKKMDGDPSNKATELINKIKSQYSPPMNFISLAD